MSRQQLPPQIRKVVVKDRKSGREVVRYEVRVDGGVNPATGARQQTKRRYATEREARGGLAEITGQAVAGVFVAKAATNVEMVCVDYLRGRHNLRASAKAKLEYDLSPLRERYGDRSVQSLTKAEIDALVGDLVAGGTKTAKGRTRRPWSAVSVNKAIDAWSMLLADAQQQGLVSRNVAERVSHVSVRHRDVDTYTEAEVLTLLAALDGDRLAHAWELALSGLRRGE
ncbi:Arm DNA-binding domain-containing protein, partial [Mycobacterium sp. E735]|uniref:Arm DNA-binding domain-containing protein n=1 Tax=Mycobacterium sp. E735 TaxID=1834148 RepID=UPI000B266C62